MSDKNQKITLEHSVKKYPSYSHSSCFHCKNVIKSLSVTNEGEVYHSQCHGKLVKLGRLQAKDFYLMLDGEL